MLLNSLIFLGFISVVLIIYPRLRLQGQNIFLLIASYVFYGYWDWRFIFLLFTLTVLNFFVAQRLHMSDSQKRRRILLHCRHRGQFGHPRFFQVLQFFRRHSSFHAGDYWVSTSHACATSYSSHWYQLLYIPERFEQRVIFS
jgi:D-alanyl-lipoteichoic acid acyltransferase DltB (MBOAT superfamily)